MFQKKEEKDCTPIRTGIAFFFFLSEDTLKISLMSKLRCDTRSRGITVCNHRSSIEYLAAGKDELERQQTHSHSFA